MIVRIQRGRAAARGAFTLLEVLVVMAILVVLAGVSSIYVFRYLDDAKKDRAKTDVQTITRAAEAYNIRFSEYPPSLNNLVQPPDGGKPYIEMDSLKDPWNQPYQYDPSGANNGGSKPDVWAVSPEGMKIGNWPVR